MLAQGAGLFWTGAEDAALGICGLGMAGVWCKGTWLRRCTRGQIRCGRKCGEAGDWSVEEEEEEEVVVVEEEEEGVVVIDVKLHLALRWGMQADDVASAQDEGVRAKYEEDAQRREGVGR